MNYFEYGDKELKYLKSRDITIAEVIESIGYIKRRTNPDPFEALVSSVISQQISTKAALTVKGRFYELTDNLDTDKISKISIEEIKSCGMSYRKAEYIKGIIDAKLEERVNFNELKSMDDEEIIKLLINLKGVGKWTVEMLLIFSLQRKNVLSYDDLGIRRGIMKAYKLNSLSKNEFQKYKELYSPYGSIASLYLWELSVL